MAQITVGTGNNLTVNLKKQIQVSSCGEIIFSLILVSNLLLTSLLSIKVMITPARAEQSSKVQWNTEVGR